MTKILIMMSMIVQWSIYANRITGPVDGIMKCVGPISQEKCLKMRNAALLNGCITEEEFDTLVKFGSAPACDSNFGVGFEQLTGWCACVHP